MVGRPAAEMDGFFRRAERDMERAFGGGLFSGNMFGGAMSSFDRMFDDATAMMNDGPDGSSSTYYYKSHTKTMGPDGVVREETVTTKPGADGNPETRRTVREGDRIAEYGPHSRAVRGPTPRSSRNDDVIIEEIDDDEDDGREPRWGRSSREESARHHASGANWFRDRYNRWASRG